MTHNKRPPVGATATLAVLQVMPGDVIKNPNNSSRLWSGEKTITPQGWIVDNEGDAWGPGAKYGSYPESPEFTLISRATPDHATTDAASAANNAKTSPLAHIITHEGREYDLTALETPPFFLPSPVVSALNVWPYGIEKMRWGDWEDADHVPPRSHIVYRAKPAPENPWFVPQDGVTYDRVEVKTIGGVLHIREVKP